MKRSCFCTWLPVLLLAAFLLLLPSAAEADTVDSGDFAGGLFWSLNEDGQLTISGEGAMPAAKGELPWWPWSNSVRSVVIEDGVTTVTPYAFSCYEQLESVTLGSTVRVVRGGESFLARAEAVDEDGALWVLDETGVRQKIFSGEVSVRGMYGYV
jgi:hypothetical protein